MFEAITEMRIATYITENPMRLIAFGLFIWIILEIMQGKEK